MKAFKKILTLIMFGVLCLNSHCPGHKNVSGLTEEQEATKKLKGTWILESMLVNENAADIDANQTITFASDGTYSINGGLQPPIYSPSGTWRFLEENIEVVKLSGGDSDQIVTDIVFSGGSGTNVTTMVMVAFYDDSKARTNALIDGDVNGTYEMTFNKQ